MNQKLNNIVIDYLVNHCEISEEFGIIKLKNYLASPHDFIKNIKKEAEIVFGFECDYLLIVEISQVLLEME